MRKGSKRELNRTATCCECGEPFACADPKASRCPTCRTCKICHVILTRTSSRVCQECRRLNRTDAQRDQLLRVHTSISGDNNPSKRANVRKKLSAQKMGDLNPARIHREKYAEHISKYRPGKVSKLEERVAQFLPTLSPQFQVKWYRIDFADSDRKIAVEVQGCWHHSCPMCFPGSPTHATQRYNAGNDKRKRQYLERLGWHMIEIWEHEIRQCSDSELKILCEKLNLPEVQSNNETQVPV